jgi:GntR family transcriptional regulator
VTTVSPKIDRPDHPYMQVADHLKRQILSGERGSGDRLPAMRDLAEDFGVGLQTVQRAIGHLVTAGLVHTTRQGTFVNGERVKPSAQARLSGLAHPASERIDVRAAEVIPCPAYVVPLLGIDGDGPEVIRREQVHYDRAGQPFMLAVSWFHPRFAVPVPELLAAEPVPSPGGAATLIGERTGHPVVRGRQAREARAIKNDGREGPLLGLPQGAACLAETYLWFSADDTIEYGEYVLGTGRVTENDFEVEVAGTGETA